MGEARETRKIEEHTIFSKLPHKFLGAVSLESIAIITQGLLLR